MGLNQSNLVRLRLRQWQRQDGEDSGSIEVSVRVGRQRGMEREVESVSGGGLVFPSPSTLAPRERYQNQCVPLHKAALQGDLESAEKLLNEDPSLIKAPLTQGHETALHIAAAEGHTSLVATILEKIKDKSDVGILNKKGCTALAFAAAQGHLDIAKLMVTKNSELPQIRGPEGSTPLFMAALKGNADIANYLLDIPEASAHFRGQPEDEQFVLLKASIDSGLYGVAIRILNINQGLAAVTDSTNGDTPLAILARNPLAFCESSQQGSRLFQSIASKVRALTKLRRDDKMSSRPCDDDAYVLFDCLWQRAICQQQDIETGEYDGNIINLVFVAAESGNYDFLVELIRKDPAFLYKVNQSNHSMFHIAVSYRHVDIFNLIYEAAGMKDLMATIIDPIKGNNILHLAAMIAPQVQRQLNDIPGAALQMQREVLWFKEVGKLEPSNSNVKNTDGLTPHELFLEQHEGLMKEGEKQMKQTAKACMLVTMLITTVVFTTAFTVPGGYDDHTGVPILEKRSKVFEVFPVSEAVATLSSLTSMLMFLSLLTSRYSENDFLTTLPFWLVMGVTMLFVSIVAMMVTFCTSLLLYEHGVAAIMLAFFACVPLMSIALKYQLLAVIVRSTFDCRWLFGSKYRLFSA